MKYPRTTIVLTAVILIASLLGPQFALAGSRTLRLGTTSTSVRTLQKYLDRSRRGDMFDYAVQQYTDYFGSVTQSGLKRWQTATGNRASGRITVGSAQWLQLKHEATAYWRSTGTTSLARHRARVFGVGIDASKSTGRVNVLRYKRSAKKLYVALSISATFGGYHGSVFYPTTDGSWSIFREGGPNDHSTEFNDAPMPWSAYFHGGEAFHYGSLEASHGCIHIPSMSAAKYIGTLPIGTPVEVHS
jgi:hypothetical protein